MNRRNFVKGFFGAAAGVAIGGLGLFSSPFQKIVRATPYVNRANIGWKVHYGTAVMDTSHFFELTSAKSARFAHD